MEQIYNTPITFNSYKERLKTTLSDLIEFDKIYDVRYHLVIKAMYLASTCGYPVGIRIDESEKDWPVVFLELPSGQISFHMSQHPLEWDKHTKEQAIDRIKKFISSK